MSGRSIILLSFFTYGGFVFARAPVSDTVMTVNESPGKTFVALPALGYTPETRFFGGLVGSLIWGSEKPSLKSSVTALMIYSQNHQVQAGVSYEIFLTRGAFRITGETYYLRWPDKFYGIGNSTPASAEEAYSERLVRSVNGVFHEVAPHLSLGLEYELRSGRIVEMSEKGLLAAKQVVGVNPYFASGLGVTMIYDTRDDNFVPLKGLYFIAGGRWFTRALGSDFVFTRYTLDGRAYLQIGDEHVMAMNVYLGGVSDGAPFQMLWLAGGESRGRGYYFGRYRDNVLMSSQVEYRSPLVWRVGFVVFGGVTEVGPALRGLSTAGIHPFAGMGVRFRLLQSARVNIRFDFGFGAASSASYIGINEAF